MTYRERRLAKAERLQEWANKREAKSNAQYATAQSMAADIPLGQPIITGRGSRTTRDINYRQRIQGNYERSFENATKAEEFDTRAAGIIAQAERAIYDDDPDAIEALTAKIADLDAQRDGIKAYNASCRTGTPDATLLHGRRAPSDGGAFPAYSLSYVSKAIKTCKDRIEAIKRMQARQQAAADNGGVTIERFPVHNWAQVTFTEKPERSVLDSLRAAGYSYSKGTWRGYLDKLPEIA